MVRFSNLMMRTPHKELLPLPSSAFLLQLSLLQWDIRGYREEVMMMEKGRGKGRGMVTRNYM